MDNDGLNTSSPAVQALIALFDQIEHRTGIFDSAAFVERAQALETLELYLPADVQPGNAVMRRADALMQRMAAADAQLYDDLVRRIQANDRAAVANVLRQTAARVAADNEDWLGYDALDMLVNGMLDMGRVPAAAQPLDADMVYYQPTPARVTLTLVDALAPTADDHLYDLGSGLGHVPILVNLLVGIRTTGVERDPAFSRYATDCATRLGLSGVAFVHADARDADYTDGTIFYLYTPFQGEILRQVLTKLETRSRQRPIRICTYGECTAQIARERWLTTAYHAGDGDGSLAVFQSLEPS